MTEQEKCERDMMLFGNCLYREVDGVIKHVPLDQLQGEEFSTLTLRENVPTDTTGTCG